MMSLLVFDTRILLISKIRIYAYMHTFIFSFSDLLSFSKYRIYLENYRDFPSFIGRRYLDVALRCKNVTRTVV